MGKKEHPKSRPARAILNSRYDGKLPAKIEYFENQDHNSVPVIAFHNGITAIFEGYGLSYREVEDIEQLTQHYQALSERLSWEFQPPEHLVNQLGYTALQSRDEDVRPTALAYFILNTENYPDSYNAFDSLGEAYELLGDVEKAVANYGRSLELNPKNEHARMRLAELGKRD